METSKLSQFGTEGIIGRRVRGHLSSIHSSVEDLEINTVFHIKRKLRTGQTIGPKEFLPFSLFLLDTIK